jgi:hypothetical protein
MRISILVLALLALLALPLGSQVATAEPITFNFTGIVDASTGIWAGSQGLAVSGFYTYDTLLVDFLVGNTQQDLFRAIDPANQAFLWEISVTVGGVTRTTASNQNAAGTQHHFLEVLDHASEDRFQFETVRHIGSDDFARFRMQDLSPDPPDGIAVGSGSLTDTAPTTAPDVALFDTVVGLSLYLSYDAAGESEGNLQFTLTSIVPVPEPVPLSGSAALLLSGLLGAVGLGVLRWRSLPPLRPSQ